MDLILSQFQNALRRFPQIFLVCKQHNFRVNLAHVNKILAHMTNNELQPNKLFFSYVVFIFLYLKHVDAEFALDQELALVLTGLINHLTDYLG